MDPTDARRRGDRRTRSRRITSRCRCPMTCRRDRISSGRAASCSRSALERWPSIRDAWHASGPGRTRDTIHAELGASDALACGSTAIPGRGTYVCKHSDGAVARWSSLRLRQSAHLRDLCAETSFTTAHLVQPIFIVEGLRGSEADSRAGRQLPASASTPRSTSSPPTSPRACVTSCCSPCREASPIGVRRLRRARGRGDQAPLRRRAAPVGRHLPVLEHRGRPLRDQRADRQIDLDATLAALEQMTLRVADAGADGVSPSDMMDGRTARLRAALDGGGHGAVPIMSYSTKFASRFYGPFRTAAGSAPKHGTSRALSDRRAFADRRDWIERALRERRRGSADGEARHDLDRSDRADSRSHRQAGRRLSGERRVCGPVRARPRWARRFRRGAARNAGRCSAAPAPPTSSPTARATRARWECRRDRSRGAVRAGAAGRARRRAESRARVSFGRRHADFHAARRRAAARSTSPAGPSSISARASGRCCSVIAIPTCAPSWPKRSTTAGRTGAASRTRWRSPSGSPRRCRGRSGSVSSRREPKR